MSLEALIAHSKVWKLGRHQQWQSVSTGFAELDRCLPGAGWPRRAITEVFVDHYGIGELRLFMPALTQLEQYGITWIAPPYIPYAPALVRYGLTLQNILMIQPTTEKDIPWAIEQVVHAHRGSTVLAWLQVINNTVLRRLQLIIEAQQAWAVFFRPIAALHEKSPAALKLYLSRQAECLSVEIVKCRGGKPGCVKLAELGGGG